MRLHLRGYFSNLLEKKREKTVNRGDKCKAKPQFYGEALTSDEVAERFAEVEAQKAASKTTKQKGIQSGWLVCKCGTIGWGNI